MAAEWDGFYAAYMSGSDGQGFAMFVFRNGVIVGVDPLGVKFDGTYSTDERGALTGHVTVTVPPGEAVIQGAVAGPNGIVYSVPVMFGENALVVDFITLQTPLGPVNIKLKKLRGMEAA